MKVVTKSSEETKQLARKLVKKITTGTALCLYGDLGAGKTTFTQGLAEYFGIKRIISPTFVLIRQYPLPRHSRVGGNLYNNYYIDPRVKPEDDMVLYHIDLYRLDSIEEIKNLGIEEIMQNKNNIVVIEWADKMKELLPQKRIDILFNYLSDNKREITIYEQTA